MIEWNNQTKEVKITTLEPIIQWRWETIIKDSTGKLITIIAKEEE